MQWVFNSSINLCSDTLWLEPQIRYLPLLTYSTKVTFCIKFAHKSGINNVWEQKIYWRMLHKQMNIRMFQHLFVPYYKHIYMVLHCPFKWVSYISSHSLLRKASNDALHCWGYAHYYLEPSEMTINIGLNKVRIVK